MTVEVIDTGRNTSGGQKVVVSRRTNVDRVSSQWFFRPDGERCLSLDDLFASLKGREERNPMRTVESAPIRSAAHRDDPVTPGLVLPGTDKRLAPLQASADQLSSLVGAPAAHLRQMPAPLPGLNLTYSLTNQRAGQIKTIKVKYGRVELCAVSLANCLDRANSSKCATAPDIPQTRRAVARFRRRV